MKDQSSNSVKQILKFEKASPEALQSILNVLNEEVDEALSQRRFPTVDGVFKRLSLGGILSSIL